MGNGNEFTLYFGARPDALLTPHGERELRATGGHNLAQINS